MLRAGWLDVPYVNGILSEYLGPVDERIREPYAIRDEVLRPSRSASAEPWPETAWGLRPWHHPFIGRRVLLLGKRWAGVRQKWCAFLYRSH